MQTAIIQYFFTLTLLGRSEILLPSNIPPIPLQSIRTIDPTVALGMTSVLKISKLCHLERSGEIWLCGGQAISNKEPMNLERPPTPIFVISNAVVRSGCGRASNLEHNH